MKVLLAGSDSSPSGAGISMITLAKELEKMDVEVDLVVKKGYTQQRLRDDGRKHFIVNAYGWVCPIQYNKIRRIIDILIKKVFNFFATIKMVIVIWKSKPDIIHVNTITTYVPAKAAILCKKKIVWHIRELVKEDFNCDFWNEAKTREMINRAHAVIAISKCVEEKFYPWLNGPQIYMIYNGVDVDKYYEKDHRILIKKNTIVTIAGRISETKGQYEVLKSLGPILKKKGIKLQIVGDGDENQINKMKAYITQYDLTDYAVLTGYMRDMPSVWRETDIAVLASKCEAFGRVIIESMCAGCLVVSSNTGGAAELIEDRKTGLLFDRTNMDDLRTTIEIAVDNIEEMREIAKRGQIWASQFTSNKNARMIKEIYTSFI